MKNMGLNFSSLFLFFFAKVWKGKGEIFLGTNLDAISVKLGIDFNCFVFYRFPAHFLCQTLLDSGVRFLSSKYKCRLGYHIWSFDYKVFFNDIFHKK